MKFTVGKKIEMTQVYQGDICVPVTRIKVLPGVVMQIKTPATDGYNSVVIGCGERRAKNIAKPQLGAMKGLGNFRFIKEFRAETKEDIAEQAKLNRGNHILLESFEVGDVCNVVGVSKGRGFQGGVKRHRFHGHNTTHGTKDQVRTPGSIGAGEPQHVFRGTRMAGHMGDEQVTVKNLKIVQIDAEAGEILVKGAIPGSRNSLIYITAKGELKFSDTAPVVEEKVEAPVVEAEPVVETPVAEEAKVEAPVVEEAKAEAPAVEEAKVEEPKVEEVKAEEPKAEEVKAEEAKEEPKAKPAKTEEPKVEAKPGSVEDQVTKFSDLPEAEQEKYSSPEAQAAITKLEEQFKVDLVPVVMKLAIKELKAEDLEAYLVNTLKIEAAAAAEITKGIKEEILK
jgi:large subunit ribosomal protein L3